MSPPGQKPAGPDGGRARLYCVTSAEEAAFRRSPAEALAPFATGAGLHPLSTEAVRALADLRFAVKQFGDQQAAVEILRSAAGLLATMAVEPGER